MIIGTGVWTIAIMLILIFFRGASERNKILKYRANSRTNKEESSVEKEEGKIIHELKTESKYFKAVCTGKKKFEVRKDDRNFNIGDTLKLVEYKDGRFQYAECNVTITYILGRNEDEKKYVPEGYVVIGIK
ncbi:hypothetical protein SDC9_57702 [bioreactor metagenome]|uniref:DUF3850 domain-containing protein n=1 Tax=bioreactor metagenome TaxID=1076179 RepID=A0A644X5M4_9ZZZZ